MPKHRSNELLFLKSLAQVSLRLVAAVILTTQDKSSSRSIGPVSAPRTNLFCTMNGLPLVRSWPSLHAALLVMKEQAMSLP
jgi:hypothetical protein